MNKALITAFAVWIPVAAWAADPAKPASKPPAPAAAPGSAKPAQPADQGMTPDAQAEAEYQRCLKLAQIRPDDGYEEALAWASMGGGEAARHCGALARIGQKQYADAAKRLEALARESRKADVIRSEMLAQAAQAWVLDGNYDLANADQIAALALDPGNPDLLIDHAVTLGQVHHYQEAVGELNKVLVSHAYRLDALILRASAYRYLDNRKAAMTDIERALSFDPGNPEALVERGILRRLDGDDKGARADWLAVIKAAPPGPVLDEAQRNLELMDVEGEAQASKPGEKSQAK
jgi:tetratricopeptide (TPR) repeat protein